MSILDGQSKKLILRMSKIRMGMEAAAHVVFADAEASDEVIESALQEFAEAVLDIRRLVPDAVIEQILGEPCPMSIPLDLIPPEHPAMQSLDHHPHLTLITTINPETEEGPPDAS